MPLGRKAAFLILLAGIASAGIAVLKPTEPSYGGKPLSQWIHQFQSSQMDDVYYPELEARRTQASAAVGAIGSNAIPALLSWARQKPPTWQYHIPYRLRMWAISFPAVRDRLYGNYPFPDAMTGFEILGTNASAAIPDLAMLLNDPDPDRLRQVRLALSYLGPKAIPFITSEMSNTPPTERWWFHYIITNNLLPTVNSQ